MKIVLQKFIANSGYCSRRQAEELIRRNQEAHKNAPVFVNGRPAELGMKVDEHDEVKIYGKIINLPKEKIYLKLNKPVGYVCTTRKFEGEKNIFELLPKNFQNLIITGRLDKDSRGLILLTNDGGLVARLTHPRYEHEKEYVAKIMNYKLRIMDGVEDLIKKFIKGIDIGEEDGIVKAKKIEYLENGRFNIVLTEGKKRQIRRMFRALGGEVEDLARVRIGNLKLGDLKEGEWRKLAEEEIAKLLKS
ncbi:MAG: pseudouridine synthase [Patescibacteria group bacterium]|nr:pseudouridine synthase [Patescibacteria group bacterium]MDD4610912.1 pseudouridine synthase [Patescibacteria group bacterium]